MSTPRHPQGTPEGAPRDPEWIPKASHGAPKGSKAVPEETPKEPKGVPRERKGIQKELVGTPREPKGIPKGAKGSQREPKHTKIYKKTPDQPPLRPLCYDNCCVGVRWIPMIIHGYEAALLVFLISMDAYPVLVSSDILLSI